MTESPNENRTSEKVSSVDARVYDRNGLVQERLQPVIKEQPVTLFLNGQEMVTLLCAGHHLDELALGFFHAEGFLKKREDLQELKVDQAVGRVDVTTSTDTPLASQLWMKRTITSGCGKGSIFYFALDALMSKPIQSDLRLATGQIVDRVEDLNRLSETYRKTHGVHNMVLATPGEVLLFRDDIGRHNAVDMVVGHLFMHGIPLDDKIFITTGRLTSEIIIKAAKVRIPVLISRNTATSLAIELARSLNITLIGYARAGKFTVYSGWERILQTGAR